MFKEKTGKSVRLYYGIFLGVFTVAVGALFLWQLLAIFNSGSAPVLERRPFSRGAVIEALSKIDLFFWLWIGFVVVGFVLWEVFPVKERPRKICPDLQYARLKERLPLNAAAGLESEYSRIRQTERLALGVKIGGYVLLGICVVVTVVYLCIPSNFPNENVTLEVLAMAKVVLPVLAAAAVLSGIGAALFKFSVKKSLPDMQKVTKGVKPSDAVKPQSLPEKIEKFFDDRRVILAIRFVLAVLALAFIIWGALNGNARAVFIKAINICTECIGLG